MCERWIDIARGLRCSTDGSSEYVASINCLPEPVVNHPGASNVQPPIDWERALRPEVLAGEVMDQSPIPMPYSSQE